jgi:hypothetical protein
MQVVAWLVVAVVLLVALRRAWRRAMDDPSRGGVSTMGVADGWLSAIRRILGDGSAPTASKPSEGPAVSATPAPALPPVDPVARFMSDDRLPPKCRNKAKEVSEAIVRVAERSGGVGSDPSLLSELDRIRGTDLPELLDRYANIPEEHRAEIFRRTQKSASFHLGESLGVMEARVAEISRLLAQGTLDGFTDATRFVDTRYGRRDDPFA